MTAFAIVLGSANANANACGNAHAADSANAYGLANAADSANAYGLANAIAHDFANVQPGSPVMIYPIELTFTRGYIAHPYWPELEANQHSEGVGDAPRAVGGKARQSPARLSDRA